MKRRVLKHRQSVCVCVCVKQNRQIVWHNEEGDEPETNSIYLLIVSNTVIPWIFQHSDVQISVRKPSDSFLDVSHSAQYNLSIQVIWKTFDKLTLDRNLMGEH